MAAKFYICFYHDKRTFRSPNQAHEEAKKMNERQENDGEQFRVFFCRETGGYHHTSITQAEMDRRQIKKEGGYGRHTHQNFESQRRRAKQTPRTNSGRKARSR